MYTKKTTGKTTRQGKANKGTVSIEAYQGRLRLRFRVGTKRYALSLGLTETKDNWIIAEAKAKELESDMIFQRFDSNNLNKYRINEHLKLITPSQEQFLTLKELWEKYLEYKSTKSKESTIDYLKV